jgi:hypothetical protein
MMRFTSTKINSNLRAMGRRFAILVMAAGSLAATPASAAPTCGPNYCDAVLVKQLYVEASGNVYLKTDGPQGSLTCTQVGGVYMTLASSATNQPIYSLLLTAHIQQMPVLIRLVDNSAGCTIAYVTSVK